MNKNNSRSHKNSSPNQLLGDYTISLSKFQGLEKSLQKFKSPDFKQLGEKQKNESVHLELCRQINEASEPCFLLAAVIDYIEQITQEKILETYSFAHFELWLNQFSNYSPEENYRIRGKIVGKWVPRDAYQTLFPIGMGKTYPGSHYVTGHNSPDLDTTVASFWGWVDAFGARVSEGLHIWNVPGGPPSSQVEISFLFDNIFGASIFDHLTKTRTSLALSGIDLMTQKGVVKKLVDETTFSIDHERSNNAVMIVDEMGYFLGDWRNFDVEGVRQVVMMLNNCLRWFESHLHIQLTSLFAREKLSKKDLPSFAQDIFGMRIEECDLVKEFTEKQKWHLDAYLVKVLKVEKGLQSSFEGFALSMNTLYISEFQEFIELFASLATSSIFDSTGNLVENRPLIFHHLEKIIRGLEKAIQSVKDYVDRLGVALDIKRDVFGYFPQVVSFRAEVEEIRSKMGNYPYLTVTSSDKEGRQIPLGVIHALDVHKPVLGTVSLRDFCNKEETKIPSYFEVISVIDHHKTSLSTLSTPNVYISDQQSSNSLVAEKAFEINDAFSLGGRSTIQVDTEVKGLEKDVSSLESKRLMQRLLQKQLVSARKSTYFIDPQREFLEYFHCLYAILDDTDLLSKVSYRDVECVTSLLNRMKSISIGSETEIISFDDLTRDEFFVAKAAKRILQNRDMYSLYRKIYSLKEESVENNLRISVKGEPSSIFSDTKEQNGCCRVGQTKMFSKNFPTFFKHAPEIRALWYVEAKEFHREREECDLHMHMISTVPSAEDVFAGTEGEYSHKDELWIWIPSKDPAIEHLKIFLNAFKQAPAFVDNDLEVEFLGDNSGELDRIFQESFLPIPRKSLASDKKISIPIAVLRYTAGTINSRKAMISPYLPKLIN